MSSEYLMDARVVRGDASLRVLRAVPSRVRACVMIACAVRRGVNSFNGGIGNCLIDNSRLKNNCSKTTYKKPQNLLI